MGLTFTSFEFIFFLGVCLGILHATGRLSVRTWLLIIFSYLFYLTFGVGGVLVLTFTAVVDFLVVVGLETPSMRGLESDGCGRPGCQSGPTSIFKYSGFLVEIIAALLHPLGARVSLPSHPVLSIIGLSYFLLQA